MRNLVLCGFMGCGKTTVGIRLAKERGMTFVDMDAYIEAQAGCTIAEIFARDGEEAFRAMEHEACLTLGAKEDLVISTGGGAVLREENVAALKQNGMIVWLQVSPMCVLARLQDDTSRPLLQRPDKAAAVDRLMREREPLYEAAADLRIDGEADPDEVVGAVIAALSFNQCVNINDLDL